MKLKVRDLWCPCKLVHWEGERYESVVNNSEERERNITYMCTCHLFNIIVRILYAVWRLVVVVLTPTLALKTCAYWDNH